MTNTPIEAKLDLARQLTLLKAYRPRNRKAKRSHKAKRCRITRAIRRAA